MKVPKTLVLAAAILAAALSAPAETGLGIPFSRPGAVPVSESDVILLGRTLFFDLRLGADRDGSCVGCHLPRRAWTDHRKTSFGSMGHLVKRNAPSIVGIAAVEERHSIARDGRINDLVEFVSNPFDDPNEFDMSGTKIEERIRSIRGYAPLFERAFGSPEVNIERVGVSIAAFVRTIQFAPSDFDRFLAGDAKALDPAERRGYELFRGKLGCTECHPGPRLTDDGFHALGTGGPKETGGSGDRGHAVLTGDPNDEGAFRTPSLVNVARTPPYFHDGSAPDLEAVIRFYEQPPASGAKTDAKRPFIKLKDGERNDLLAFLSSLDAMEPLPPGTSMPKDPLGLPTQDCPLDGNPHLPPAFPEE